MQSIDEPQLTFLTRTIEAMTGVNRGSLVFYEKQGILNPIRREESGYRLYGPEDLNRLISLCMMKNAGMLITDAWPEEQIPGTQENTDGLLKACLESNNKILAWHRAIEEALTAMQALFSYDSILVPRLREVEARSVWFNHTEPHEKLSPSTVRSSYTRLSPVASFTSIYELDAFLAPKSPDGRWGVSIPDRLLGVAGILDDPDRPEADEIPAQRCATIPFQFPTGKPHIIDPDFLVRGKLLAFVEREGLRPSGQAILMDYLPVGQMINATLNLPVEGQ